VEAACGISRWLPTLIAI